MTSASVENNAKRRFRNSSSVNFRRIRVRRISRVGVCISANMSCKFAEGRLIRRSVFAGSDFAAERIHMFVFAIERIRWCELASPLPHAKTDLQILAAFWQSMGWGGVVRDTIQDIP